MPIEISGFAQSLARCQVFRSVEPGMLESVLSESGEPLEMAFAAPSNRSPLIESGSAFTHLVFIQHGVVIPWQFPHSELTAPFLIGDHELLMGAERWVANYSARTESTVVRIPVGSMKEILDRLPSVREQMHQTVSRRFSRFYWTSLATTGSLTSRVAAALVSRLALDGSDFGYDRTIRVMQKDLARLTALSRSAAADGLSELANLNAISLERRRTRFTGIVEVPDVNRLKDCAFSEFRKRISTRSFELAAADEFHRSFARSKTSGSRSSRTAIRRTSDPDDRTARRPSRIVRPLKRRQKSEVRKSDASNT